MREPDAGEGRLTPVTAQNRAPERAHDAHDRLLVARHASGDPLAADEVAALRSQLASCPACVDLAADLTIVQRAVATSTTVARPRDFRITAQQAQALRPGAWQRLLARFSAPSVRALRPLAGATLAVGIVVAGVGAVAPGQVASPSTESAPVTQDAPPPSGDPNGTVLLASPANDGRATDHTSPKSTFALDQTMESTGSPDTTSRMAVMGSPTPTQAAMAQAPEASAAPVGGGNELVVATSDAGMGPLLLLVGGALAAASLLVLAMAWLARRNQDPLLR